MLKMTSRDPDDYRLVTAEKQGVTVVTADELAKQEAKYKSIEIYPPNWQTLPDWESPTGDPKHRLLVNAVPEARKYRRDVCNQGCGRHLYMKDRPYEQTTGEVHECPIITIVRMCEGYYDMIRIKHIENCPITVIMDVIENQRKRNRLYAGAWYYWKKTRKVPRIKDIEEGKYLEHNATTQP